MLLHAIYKNMRQFKIKTTKNKQDGFVLILSVLILGVTLMTGAFIINNSNTERKIASAQHTATKNYYLAEAGISNMIWKLQNDSNYEADFIAGLLDTNSAITQTNVFGDTNAQYVVTAYSTAPGEAQVIATSTYALGNQTSQRVIKAYLTRPDNATAEWEYSTFAGGRGSQQNGNFTFTGSGILMTANGGRLHANQVVKVQKGELVINDGAVTSGNVIDIVAGGSLTLNNSYQDAPTSTVDMLQIDFDSDDSNSWKNRATATYSENTFKNLPNNTILNGIIFVEGDAKIIGKNMTINGVLVAEEDIDITLSGQTLTVNADETYGGGLLAKDDLDFVVSGATLTLDGLLYGGDDLSITSSGSNFTINGSMTAFDAKITASGGGITLNYSPENFSPVIDPIVNPEAPLLQVDHWEELY